MNIALLIAIEEYADPQIARRMFAAADARAIGGALAGLGYSELDQVVLIDGQATKTILESKIRRTLRSLAPEDTLLVFVSAHGCSVRGQDYLICHDTQAADLVATSLALKSLLDQLRGLDCERVICLFDSCASGLPVDELQVERPQQGELEQHFASQPQQACFLACSPGETSWSALNLKHGVWASQLIIALEGKATSALVNRELLTAASLQKFLEESVPRALERSSSAQRQQHPRCCSANENFLVADLSELFATRTAAGIPAAEDVLRVTLLREQVESIRSLPGFKKTDKTPTVVNSYAKGLVADLGAEPIAADVNEVREALRKHFSFKRKDLDAAAPGDGTGSILTPYFVYSVTVTLNPANPAEIVWRRQITDIKEPEQVLSAAFASVFPKTFSTVEFAPPQPIDLPAFIDEIEDTGDERVKIQYDAAATWCRLSMIGLLGQVEVTPSRFALLQLNPTSPRTLLEAFFKIQAMLVQELDVLAIGFKK